MKISALINMFLSIDQDETTGKKNTTRTDKERSQRVTYLTYHTIVNCQSAKCRHMKTNQKSENIPDYGEGFTPKILQTFFEYPSDVNIGNNGENIC